MRCAGSTITSLALSSLVALSACVSGLDHEDPSDLFEAAFEENEPGKADVSGCSGVTVPDQSNFSKRVALTFDDGPNPATTPQVLATLRAHNVPATFFINGNRVNSDEARAIAADIVADPLFILANHTWSHQNMATLSADTVASQIDRTTTVMRAAGATPVYFRFPFGSSTCDTADAVRDRDYRITGWHIDSGDWCYAAGGGVCKKSTFKHVPDQFRSDMKAFVMQQVRARNGGILLFHDIHAFTAGELDGIITTLKSEGYTFTNIDDTGAFPLLNGVTPPPRAFIGDACAADSECNFDGGFCYMSGGAGVCTKGCTSSCPDRADRPTTRCVAVVGEQTPGLCSVECDNGMCSGDAVCSPMASPAGVQREVCWLP